MTARTRRILLLVALAAACLTMSGTTTSLALLTGRANAAAIVGSGTWSYYLHNNPTPPPANTTAQVNLTATTIASTATTLRRYDTNCANRAGRGLILAAPTPTQASACYYANWLTPVQATPLKLQGSVTLDIWSATNQVNNGVTGALIVYLRDYNPALLTYAEITNYTFTGTYNRRTWVHTPITIPIAGTPTLAAGHQLEVKVEAPSTATAYSMLVAYDTTTYPAFVRVR
jgi:hypothetical protein